MRDKNILIICPKFVPTNDGLSDYASEFVKNLGKRANVAVLTHKDATCDVKNVKLFNTNNKWNLFALVRAFLQINKEISYDEILIQYVPYMYGRAGINLSLPFFMILLKFFNKEKKIHLMCHEMWYPFFLHEPKSWIIHTFHRFSLTCLVTVSEKVFCSTENFVKEFEYYFPLYKGEYYHLPVPSNIVIEAKVKRNEYKSPLKLVHFGSLHSSKSSIEFFDLLATKIDDRIELYFIGLTESSFKEQLQKSTYDTISKHSVFLGKIAQEKVVETFQQCDLLLAYYIDGATTRRGSLMAALKYGLPALTTISSTTDDSLKKTNLIFVENNIYAYINKLLEVLEKGESISDGHTQLIKHYEENYSWQIIIDKFCLLKSYPSNSN